MSDNSKPMKIAVDKLSMEQLQQLVMMHEQAVWLLIACNNELGLRFEGTDGRTPEQTEMFELWSQTVNTILEATDRDVEAIIFGNAGENGRAN